MFGLTHEINIFLNREEVDEDFGLVRWFDVVTLNPAWAFSAQEEEWMTRQFAVTVDGKVIDGEYLEEIQTDDDLELEEIEKQLKKQAPPPLENRRP